MIHRNASRIPYLRFAAHLLPLAAIGLAIDFVIVARVYRRTLATALSGDTHVTRDAAGGSDVSVDPGRNAGPNNDDDASNRRAHVWLQRKSAVVTLISIALFFAGFQIALVAIGAAAVLLIDPIESERIYDQIDWTFALLMFVGQSLS